MTRQDAIKILGNAFTVLSNCAQTKTAHEVMDVVESMLKQQEPVPHDKLENGKWYWLKCYWLDGQPVQMISRTRYTYTVFSMYEYCEDFSLRVRKDSKFYGPINPPEVKP